MKLIQIIVVGGLMMSPQDSSMKKQIPVIVKFDTIEKSLKEKDEYIRKMIANMDKEIKQMKAKKK